MAHKVGEVVGRNPTNLAQTIILFYGRQPVYSNFYILPFKTDGRQFNCTEQYFQYRKAIYFGDVKTAAKIMKTISPRQQKKLGRQVNRYEEQRWKQVRFKIMEEGCMAKFTQNNGEREKLLATGDSRLAECSPTDKIWAIGLSLTDHRALNPKKWKGQNLMGAVLENVRDCIAEKDE